MDPLQNDERSRAILLNPPWSNETDREIRRQLVTERAAGHRASAIDPPFASLAEKAKALESKLEDLEREICFVTEAYAEWTDQIGTYGFASEPPERLLAIAIVAALQPELENAVLPRRNGRVAPSDLAPWLLEQPRAVRMLNRATSYATCTFVSLYEKDSSSLSQNRDAIERAFIGRVFAEILEELEHCEPPL